jgi:tRNA (cmo5U34)-methyltransferase
VTPWTNKKLPIINWEFNESIADVFVEHARKHIPDYDRVIDLNVNICKMLLKNCIEDKVIDVGCATGETINRLWASGLHNLIGVDNSKAMLERCQNKNAVYIHSDSFPKENGPYSAILCNWTLHFIKDKQTYLKNMFNGLCNDGFLILSEKTCNEGADLELYHNFKRSKGVSDEEIKIKAQSLQNVMFVHDVNWYLKTLEVVGFKEVTIVNSAPCFTTFLARK